MLVVSMALPAAATAESVVPPGNSAATQYTETFPTSGGNVEVNGSLGGGGRAHRTPSQALGDRTAHELESQGAEGRAVANLASESVPGSAAGPGSEGGHGSGAGGKGGDGGAGGGKGGGAGGNGAEAAGGGSSGVGQVLSHATLSDSGQMGIFLPLVLIASLACALLYAWRRHGRRDVRA